MTETQLKCKLCGIDFTTPLKRYNHLTKGGRKVFYCSKICFINDVKSSPIVKNCLWCKKEYLSNTQSRSKKCCSSECSGKYSQSFLDPQKVSIQSKISWKKRNYNHMIRNCVVCRKQFKKKYTKCCSKKCSKIMMSIGGRNSSNVQSIKRRSKNEILFSDLCKQNYKNVFTNKPVFNGWDADIILLDWEVAILWNGKWHYEKITEKHSVKQVQNRDKIKLDEIIKFGYIPYVIKDLGKFNPKFVKEEFEKFQNWLHNTMVV